MNKHTELIESLERKTKASMKALEERLIMFEKQKKCEHDFYISQVRKGYPSILDSCFKTCRKCGFEIKSREIIRTKIEVVWEDGTTEEIE